MKVEKKIENRSVLVTKEIDTFVLTLDRDEAEVLLAVVGSLALKYDGNVRKVTNRLYDQLRTAGLRAELHDPNRLSGYASVSVGPMNGSTNNPIVRPTSF